MKLEKANDLDNEKFRRLTGVKRSTFNQMIMSKKRKKIICTSFSKGRRHDFRVFKESKNQFYSEINLLTDGGYRGLKKLHIKTQMLKRRTKKTPLYSTSLEKRHYKHAKLIEFFS